MNRTVFANKPSAVDMIPLILNLERLGISWQTLRLLESLARLPADLLDGLATAARWLIRLYTGEIMHTATDLQEMCYLATRETAIEYNIILGDRVSDLRIYSVDYSYKQELEQMIRRHREKVANVMTLRI